MFADQHYQIKDRGIHEGKRQVEVYQTRQPDHILQLDLQGSYQLHNLPGVLATVEALQGVWPVDPEAEERGLAAVTTITGLKGRFQTLQEHPRVIADTAHNPPGLAALLESLHTIPHRTLRIILGLVADKDRSAVLDALPQTAVYYFCQAQTPRSLPVEVLQAEAGQIGRVGAAYPDVNSALAAALQQASSTDLILITGSNYTIAELTHL